LRLSDRLRALDDPIAMQRTACTMVGEHLGVNRCMFTEVEGDEFVPGPSYLSGVDPLPQVRQSIYVFGDALVEAARHGDTVWCEDVNQDPRFTPELLERYSAMQIASFAGVILVKGGRFVAAFAVHSATPRPWPQADLDLLREVGDRIWDAVERARAEAALRRSEEQLRRAMTLRDEFLAVLSHELRTPLSAILIWAKMLRAGAVKGEDQAQAIAVIEQSAIAQRKLIEDLLDVSGMISGKLRVQLENAELGPVLTAAVEAVRPMADAKRINLTADFGDAPVFSRVDRARLQQVVWNLANNAVKFTPSGGHVTVRLRRLESTVRIEVADTGRGIAPAFLPYVFERFRQADSSTTRADGGLGLGLAIARQLVELHGGVIEARSEGEGRGATFIVVLPRIEAELPPEDVHERDVRATTTSAPFVPEPLLRGVRVLFVEDEAHTRAVVQWLLEQCGAIVAPATCAREALAMFDAAATEAASAEGDQRFDVLVSDVGLPEQDGYELLTEVRRRPGGQRLPALALTAYAREEDRQRAIDAGFSAYLAKPVEPRMLVEMLAGMVHRDM
jgi:signal transduction histidine kinase